MKISVKDDKHTNLRNIEVTPGQKIGDTANAYADSRGYADVPSMFTFKPLGAAVRESFRMAQSFSEAGVKDGDVLELQSTTIAREITAKPEKKSRARKAGGGSAKPPRKSTARKGTTRRASTRKAQPADVDPVKVFAQFSRRANAAFIVVEAARELHEKVEGAFGETSTVLNLGSALKLFDKETAEA